MSGATAAISVAATVISTAVGMYSQSVAAKQQEKAAKDAAYNNAQIAENQQAVQEGLARNEMQKGINDRERQQRKAAQAMADMRAQMGAAGFEIDSGTNLSLLAESAQEHQYDSQVTLSNAQQAAWAHQVGATNAENSKNFALYQGEQAWNNGLTTGINMAGTLLGGIASGIGNVSALNQYSTSGSGYAGASSVQFGQSSGVSSSWSKNNPYAWVK